MTMYTDDRISGRTFRTGQIYFGEHVNGKWTFDKPIKARTALAVRHP